MKNKIKNFILIASVMLLVTAVIYSSKKSNIFYCTTHVDDFNKNYTLHTDLHIFIFSDKTGFISHKGKVIENKSEYIIDREIPFLITDENKYGVITLKLKKTIKKPHDNVPNESVLNKMHTIDLKYYPTILKTKNDDIIITERGAPLYVCTYKNK